MAVRKTHVRFNPKPLFFALLAVFILGIAFLTYDRTLPVGNMTGKPNVIVIMTDDQRYDSMDGLPNVVEKLGGRGVTFTNAFVTTPLCCPSRASFLTGKYAHNTGVWRNNPPEGGVESFKDTDTLAVWLKDAGYKTALIGKYMNGYRKSTYIPPGWSEWHAFTKGNYYGYMMNENGVLTDYGYEEEDYSATVVQNKAIDFIRDVRRSGDPFFLLVTPNNPHGDSGKNIDEEEDDFKGARPAPRHKDSCVEITPYRPPNFNEEDMSDKPQFMQEKRLLNDKKIAEIDYFHKSQKCALRAVDEMVEKIVTELGQLRENTAIIYYSDNGYAYGEHRDTSKNCLYEECARIPLIISYPKITTKPSVSQSFATNVDLTATILAITGVTPEAKINGKSLLPILSTPNKDLHEEILLEVNNNKTDKKDYAVRTKQYKFIERGSGETELYDMVQDPFELVNVRNQVGYQEIITRLEEKLVTLKSE